MDNTSQKRAVRNYRSRLSQSGLVRFEVIGRDGDRALIRSLARRLAEGGPEADRIRNSLDGTVDKPPSRKGGVLAALQASPLVGSGIDLTKTRHPGRDIDL